MRKNDGSCRRGWRVCARFARGTALLAWMATPIANAAPEDRGPLEHLVRRLDETQRARVVPIVRAAATNAYVHQSAVLDILLVLNPDLVKALVALNVERPAEALSILERLAASEDPFLAKHAAWFRIRGLMGMERYEEALAALPPVQTNAAQYTQLSDEMLYTEGLLQSYLLDRTAAAATLRRYLTQYPQAPPERRGMAMGLLEEIALLNTNSLPEAVTLMNESRRRLHLNDSGDVTQTRQRQIVRVFDKLIEELEKQQQGGGGGGGSSGGGGGGGAGAKESSLAGGASGTQLGKVGDSGDPDKWAKAYARDREAVQRELQGHVPERYRDLIEQYYRSLSAGENAGAGEPK